MSICLRYFLLAIFIAAIYPPISQAKQDTPTLDRTTSGEWHIFIPPKLQISRSESRTLQAEMTQRVLSEQQTIRQLDDDLAVMHAIDFVNELLADELGIKLEYVDSQKAYILTIYLSADGLTRIKSLQIPSIMTEYDLRALLISNAKEKVTQPVKDLSSSREAHSYSASDDCTMSSCEEADDWEDYVREMLELICGPDGDQCFGWGTNPGFDSSGRIEIVGWYKHIDGSSDYNFLHATFPVSPETPPREAIEL